MPGKKSDKSERTAMDMLTRSHRKLHQRLAELANELRNAAPDAEVVADVLAFLRGPLANHVADEEQSAFPRLDASHREVVARLVDEHRDNEATLAALEDAWNAGDVATASTLAETLESAWTAHSELEERTVWPALAALPPAAAWNLRTEMKRRRKRA